MFASGPGLGCRQSLSTPWPGLRLRARTPSLDLGSAPGNLNLLVIVPVPESEGVNLKVVTLAETASATRRDRAVRQRWTAPTLRDVILMVLHKCTSPLGHCHLGCQTFTAADQAPGIVLFQCLPASQPQAGWLVRPCPRSRRPFNLHFLNPSVASMDQPLACP